MGIGPWIVVWGPLLRSSKSSWEEKMWVGYVQSRGQMVHLWAWRHPELLRQNGTKSRGWLLTPGRSSQSKAWGRKRAGDQKNSKGAAGMAESWRDAVLEDWNSPFAWWESWTEPHPLHFRGRNPTSSVPTENKGCCSRYSDHCIFLDTEKRQRS